MRNRSTKGFTLIELLIVIAIIGILAAVLIPNLMRARNVAVDRAAEGYAQNVYTAANAYMSEDLQVSVAEVVALDGDCADGVAYGEYGTNEPSFTVNSCVVSDAGTNVLVTLDYSGGVNGASNVVTVP